MLLECSRLYGKVRRFINVSTDEVYGESSLGKEEGLNEGSPLEPTNPYSAAKVGAGACGLHAAPLLEAAARLHCSDLLCCACPLALQRSPLLCLPAMR